MVEDDNAAECDLMSFKDFGEFVADVGVSVGTEYCVSVAAVLSGNTGAVIAVFDDGGSVGNVHDKCLGKCWGVDVISYQFDSGFVGATLGSSI